MTKSDNKDSDQEQLATNLRCVRSALDFVDNVERDLGAALDECGGICEGNLEDLPLLTSALLGAWRNLRYARRELDPSAWARYRATTEPAEDDEIDTSDNDAGAAQ